MSSQDKVFYSPYGYITIPISEYNNNTLNNLSFSTQSNIKGKINRLNITEEITINLKTFYSKRETYQIKININNQINDIIKRLFEIESSRKIPIENRFGLTKQYRIISTRIKIHELNSKNNFIKEKILLNEILILLPIKNLSFINNIKEKTIFLAKNNTIVSKINSDDPKYVIGDLSYTKGKNYFEILLLTEPIEKSVIIGVSSLRETGNVKNFYGYILSDLKRISSINGKTEQHEFGDISKIGDRVGVIVDFCTDGVQIGFYVNKVFLGYAYTKVNEKVLNPCVALGLMGTKIMITNQVDFPDI